MMLRNGNKETKQKETSFFISDPLCHPTVSALLRSNTRVYPVLHRPEWTSGSSGGLMTPCTAGLTPRIWGGACEPASPAGITPGIRDSASTVHMSRRHLSLLAIFPGLRYLQPCPGAPGGPYVTWWLLVPFIKLLIVLRSYKIKKEIRKF